MENPKRPKEWSIKYRTEIQQSNTFSTEFTVSHLPFRLLCNTFYTYTFLHLVFNLHLISPFDSFVLFFFLFITRIFYERKFFILVFIVNSIDASKTDNVDRRFGKRFNNWHWLYERTVAGFKACYGQINSKIDTEKGTSQYNVHMPSTKHCRQNVSLCKTSARGK